MIFYDIGIGNVEHNLLAISEIWDLYYKIYCAVCASKFDMIFQTLHWVNWLSFIIFVVKLSFVCVGTCFCI